MLILILTFIDMKHKFIVLLADVKTGKKKLQIWIIITRNKDFGIVFD